MKKLLIGCSILFFCYAGTCRKNPLAKNVFRIWVENKTNKAITFLVSRNYPDTTIPDEENKLRGVAPSTRNPYDFSEKKWSDVFDNLPADTLSVFIFSGDTLVKYNWQQIRSGYKILKRYDLSRQDIERLNYTTTYP
jgi:hypothetical protein